MAATMPIIPAVSARKPLVLPIGATELMKWVALVLMTGDHINKFLFAERFAVVYAAGRVAMPLFVFVLAYNLARPGALERGVYGRTLKRLLIAGAITSPVFFGLVGFWPLNIMFMLALATAMLWLFELGGRWRIASSLALFVVGGAFVEFWWPAIALCLAAWWFCKAPGAWRAVLVLLASVCLHPINRNSWALAAIPVAVLLSYVDVPMPRVRYLFYAYYPAHLTVLWLVTQAMT